MSFQEYYPMDQLQAIQNNATKAVVDWARPYLDDCFLESKLKRALDVTQKMEDKGLENVLQTIETQMRKVIIRNHESWENNFTPTRYQDFRNDWRGLNKGWTEKWFCAYVFVATFCLRVENSRDGASLLVLHNLVQQRLCDIFENDQSSESNGMQWLLQSGLEEAEDRFKVYPLYPHHRQILMRKWKAQREVARSMVEALSALHR